MLLTHFTKGTERTETGRYIGAEIETDFLMEDGSPIPEEVTRDILRAAEGQPSTFSYKLELGRQKIECSFVAQPNIHTLFHQMERGLNWLYKVAANYGAQPFFEPVVNWDGNLLYVQEERDEIWVQLDGRRALEHLCRCSSVQFTIDVNPEDAIQMINNLWCYQLPIPEYRPNHEKWLSYLADTQANYRVDRYGGPPGFYDIDDYVRQLMMHDVVMHKGRSVQLKVDQVSDLNIDLFLRSIWWHYRLRRYENRLVVEIRPLPRQRDEDISEQWRLVASATGL